MMRILLAFFGALVFLPAYSQCLLKELTLQELADEAELIFEGEVVSQYGLFAGQGMIFTANEIEVHRVYQGAVSTNTITLFTQGGQVGDQMVKAEPSLNLSHTSHGLFMAKPGNINGTDGQKSGYICPAGPQGFLKYQLGKAHGPFLQLDIKGLREWMLGYTGKEDILVSKHIPIPKVKRSANISFSPTTVTAGTKTLLTISGSGFGSTRGKGVVFFTNPDDGGKSLTGASAAGHYKSWSDSKIEVYVPGRSGTGKILVQNDAGTQQSSSGDLTVSYARSEIVDSQSDVHEPVFEDDNGDGGYTYKFHSEFMNNKPALRAFLRAIANWRCKTLVNFGVDTITSTSIDTNLKDKSNVVRFDNGAGLPTGVLGVSYSYYTGCFRSSTQDFHWFLDENDVVFDNGTNWNYSGTPSNNQSDFESVALHELGHSHQLLHIIDNDGVMHFSITQGTSKRVLDATSDIAGGTYIVDQSTKTSSTGCSSTDFMTKLKSSECELGQPPVAAFSADKTAICAGESVTFTNESTGSYDKLRWSFEGGSPATSSAEKPSVTYSTPGVYKVSLKASNASEDDTEEKNGYITVRSLPTITSADITHVSCKGGNDGSIDVTASGTGTLIFIWLPSLLDDKSSHTDLPTGTYRLTLQDGNGCQSAEQTYVVNEPDVALAISSTGSVADEDAKSTGKAWVEVSGGDEPYEYSWDDPASSKTDTAFNLAEGDYTVTVKDANDCEITETIKVEGLFTGISQAGNRTEEAEIYPNPFSSTLQVRLEQSGIASIWSLQGEQLTQKQISGTQSIDLSNLPKGSYLVKLSIGSQVVKRQLIQKH